MTQTLLILLLLAAAVWFAVVEAPALFGLYEQAHSLRRWVFALVVSLTVVVFMMDVPDGGVAEGLSVRHAALQAEGMTLLVVILASFLSLLLLKMLSFNGSVIYAVLGAFGACALKTEGSFQGGLCLIYYLLWRHLCCLLHQHGSLPACCARPSVEVISI